jgi:hypothetical protein
MENIFTLNFGIYFLAFLLCKCPYRVVFIVILYRITKLSHGRMLNLEKKKIFYCPLEQGHEFLFHAQW